MFGKTFVVWWSMDSGWMFPDLSQCWGETNRKRFRVISVRAKAVRQ